MPSLTQILFLGLGFVLLGLVAELIARRARHDSAGTWWLVSAIGGGLVVVSLVLRLGGMLPDRVVMGLVIGIALVASVELFARILRWILARKHMGAVIISLDPPAWLPHFAVASSRSVLMAVASVFTFATPGPCRVVAGLLLGLAAVSQFAWDFCESRRKTVHERGLVAFPWVFRWADLVAYEWEETRLLLRTRPRRWPLGGSASVYVAPEQTEAVDAVFRQHVVPTSS